MRNAANLEQVLRRTDIPRGQITLLKELYEREGEFVSYSELVEKIRWNEEERFPGVLGAFGNRINQTDNLPGQPGSDAFIERKRINGELHYRLRPEAREAIEEVPVLVEKFDQSMETLLKSGTKIEYEELSP